MKSASLPSLRVTPDLRRDAESVLKEGESLSSFIEESLRKQIEHRRFQSEFIARGLAARDRAKTTGRYVAKDEVSESLGGILQKAKQNQ